MRQAGLWNYKPTWCFTFPSLLKCHSTATMHNINLLWNLYVNSIIARIKVGERLLRLLWKELYMNKFCFLVGKNLKKIFFHTLFLLLFLNDCAILSMLKTWLAKFFVRDRRFFYPLRSSEVQYVKSLQRLRKSKVVRQQSQPQ